MVFQKRSSKLLVIIINMVTLDEILKENLNLRLSPAQTRSFTQYEQLLLEWNEKFNLTSIRDPEEVRIKHFYDSLTCLDMLPQERFSLIDVGSGAGFPGIPIKIVRPDIRLVLLDSVGKKVDFCRVVIHELALEGVEILHERAEILGQIAGKRESFDVVTARALAALPLLLEYLLPLARVGGFVLAQKGSDPQAEVMQAKRALSILGGEICEVRQLELPGGAGQRSLIKITKIHATPPQYPRKAGIPAKKPLL